MEPYSEVARTGRFETASGIFKQLENPTRLRIFWFLCHCEKCVTEIASALSMSSPAVSHHLRELKSCGLIVSSRSGKEVYYKAACTPTAQLLHMMVEQVLKIACPENE